MSGLPRYRLVEEDFEDSGDETLYEQTPSLLLKKTVQVVQHMSGPSVGPGKIEIPLG